MSENSSTKSQVPPDIMIFKLGISKLIQMPIELPPNLDEKWMTICDSEEFVYYTDLIKHISACKDPSLIIKAFDQNAFQLDYLTSELSRHLKYLNKIMTSEQVLKFTSQMRLDPQSLYNILGVERRPLFNCALYLLKTILSIVQEESEQKDIFFSFVNYLIPKDLLEFRRKRPYIKTILYLPAISIADGSLGWLSLNREKNVVRKYSFENPQSPVKTFSNDAYSYDIYAERICFTPLTTKGAEKNDSYNLITANAGRTWIDAFKWNEEYDPLLVFLSSFPHIIEFSKYLPDEFLNQLCNIVSAPDLDLARAICTTAANEFRDGDHTKNACLAVLFLLNKSGYLTQFIRSAFADAIDETKDTTNILRMSSIASMSSGIILTNCENGLSGQLAEIMKSERDNLPNAIRKLMTTSNGFTPPMRFVLSAAFRSTRRKFPDYLVPLNAISSILMLRYLVTELTKRSIELAKVCQTLTLTLMFSTKVEQLPEDLYKQLALFLANLTHFQNSNINLNTNEIQAKKDLINFILFQKEDNNYISDIVKSLSNLIANPEHQIKWSIIEVIENICNGVDEIFDVEMKSKTFLPQRYTRKPSQKAQES